MEAKFANLSARTGRHDDLRTFLREQNFKILPPAVSLTAPYDAPDSFSHDSVSRGFVSRGFASQDFAAH